MAKSFIQRAIEQSVMAFVRQASNKAAKNAIGRAEDVIKKRSDQKKAAKKPDNSPEENSSNEDID